jgi:hypothetical protein
MTIAGNARTVAGLLRDAWIEYQRDRAPYLAVACSTPGVWPQ